MKASLWGVLLSTAAASAGAQVISGSVQVTHDSDSFNEQRYTLGYTGAQGWGLKVGGLHYSAPGWSDSGSLLAGTYKSTTAERQMDASVGVTQLAQHDHAVGAFNYLRRVQASTSLGLSVERDLVNSVGGITAGLTYTALALVADHAFTDRFNVGVAAGTTLFSDDNQRPILRTRWNYALEERSGLNAYLKTRTYQNSRPYRAAYFSPDRLNEVSLGLSTRVAVANNVVLSANADAGQQWADGASEPIWSAALSLGSRRGSSIEWMAGLEATNTAALFGSQSSSYHYISAVARIGVPF